MIIDKTLNGTLYKKKVSSDGWHFWLFSESGALLQKWYTLENDLTEKERNAVEVFDTIIWNEIN